MGAMQKDRKGFEGPSDQLFLTHTMKVLFV